MQRLVSKRRPYTSNATQFIDDGPGKFSTSTIWSPEVKPELISRMDELIDVYGIDEMMTQIQAYYKEEKRIYNDDLMRIMIPKITVSTLYESYYYSEAVKRLQEETLTDINEVFAGLMKHIIKIYRGTKQNVLRRNLNIIDKIQNPFLDEDTFATDPDQDDWLRRIMIEMRSQVWKPSYFTNLRKCIKDRVERTAQARDLLTMYYNVREEIDRITAFTYRAHTQLYLDTIFELQIPIAYLRPIVTHFTHKNGKVDAPYMQAILPEETTSKGERRLRRPKMKELWQMTKRDEKIGERFQMFSMNNMAYEWKAHFTYPATDKEWRDHGYNVNKACLHIIMEVQNLQRISDLETIEERTMELAIFQPPSTTDGGWAWTKKEIAKRLNFLWSTYITCLIAARAYTYLAYLPSKTAKYWQSKLDHGFSQVRCNADTLTQIYGEFFNTLISNPENSGANFEIVRELIFPESLIKLTAPVPHPFTTESWIELTRKFATEKQKHNTTADQYCNFHIQERLFILNEEREAKLKETGGHTYQRDWSTRTLFQTKPNTSPGDITNQWKLLKQRQKTFPNYYEPISALKLIKKRTMTLV